MSKNYEPVIGLEVHLQLKTRAKMFSSAPAEIWQAAPNTQVAPVDLGLPGALPVPNAQAIQWTQQLGHVLGCELSAISKFDRKHYFYPDLPKGFQISQYDQPLCLGGALEIPKKIRIRRIHLEEDTGKSIHQDGKTYLDFNKAGVPLVELVTEPDFTSADECSEFAKMLQQAIRTLGIGDADMEKGNFRLEANVSVRPRGKLDLPDYRVELKNINSFKFMRQAINFEIERQIALIKKGEEIEQQTRGWNETKQQTVLQRIKEDAHDYRYFPEPDIPPLYFDTAYFDQILKDLPSMPWQNEKILIEQGVRKDFAKMIVYTPEKWRIFEDFKSQNQVEIGELGKIIANTLDPAEVKSKLAQALSRSQGDTMPDSQLKPIIHQIMIDHPQAVTDYQKGKSNALKFLVGQTIRQTHGQANAQTIEKFLKQKLNSAGEE